MKNIKVTVIVGEIKVNYSGPQDFFSTVVDKASEFALNIPSQRNEKHKDGTAKIKPTKKKPTSSKVTKSSSNNNQTVSSKVDAKTVADKIKTSSNFAKLKSNFILKDKDFLNKAKLAMFYSDDDLTTGDVERVFKELGVKVSLPSISKSVSGNLDQFFKSGDTPARFSMTAPTKVTFETYLSELDD